MEKYIALQVKCPECGKSLMNSYITIHDKPTVKLDVVSGGKQGTVNLCAYYGCTEHTGTFERVEGEISQFFCPHCHQELVSKHTCKTCDAPMVPFSIDKGGVMHMCARAGCNSHYLEFQNVSDALRKMYNEFGYF